MALDPVQVAGVRGRGDEAPGACGPTGGWGASSGGEVVHHQVDAEAGGIPGPDGAKELKDAVSVLVFGHLSPQHVRPDIVGAEEVADSVARV